MFKVILPDPIITDTTVNGKIFIDIDLTELRKLGMCYAVPNTNWNFIGFLFNDKFVNGLPYFQEEFSYQRNFVRLNGDIRDTEDIIDGASDATFALLKQDSIILDPSMKIEGRNLDIEATEIGLSENVTNIVGKYSSKYTGTVYPQYKLVARYWTNTPIDSTIDFSTDITSGLLKENAFSVDYFANYAQVVYYTQNPGDVTSADTESLVINALTEIVDGTALINLSYQEILFSTDSSVSVYIDGTLTDTTSLAPDVDNLLVFHDTRFTEFDMTISDHTHGFDMNYINKKDALLFLPPGLLVTLYSTLESTPEFGTSISQLTEYVLSENPLCASFVFGNYFYRGNETFNLDCTTEVFDIMYLYDATTDPGTEIGLIDDLGIDAQNLDSSGYPYTEFYVMDATWTDTTELPVLFGIDATAGGNDFDWEIVLKDTSNNIVAQSSIINDPVYYYFAQDEVLIQEIHLRSAATNNNVFTARALAVAAIPTTTTTTTTTTPAPHLPGEEINMTRNPGGSGSTYVYIGIDTGQVVVNWDTDSTTVVNAPYSAQTSYDFGGGNSVQKNIWITGDTSNLLELGVNTNEVQIHLNEVSAAPLLHTFWINGPVYGDVTALLSLDLTNLDLRADYMEGDIGFIFDLTNQDYLDIYGYPGPAPNLYYTTRTIPSNFDGISGWLNDLGLSQAETDALLGDLDTMSVDGTGGSLDVSGNSVPSATGLASIASLEGKGWTITYDEPPTTTTTTPP